MGPKEPSEQWSQMQSKGSSPSESSDSHRSETKQDFPLQDKSETYQEHSTWNLYQWKCRLDKYFVTGDLHEEDSALSKELY